MSINKELKEYIDAEINKLRVENEINTSHINTLYEKLNVLNKWLKKCTLKQ